jgi:polar amino acid transport system substrate-binding protein
MKRKLPLFIVIALLLFLGAWLISQISPATLVFSGIDLKPNYFELDGEIVGIDADIAAAAMEKAGIKVKFKVDSIWTEAYHTTLSGPKRALCVAYTEERIDLFKWAGPISKGAYDIFAKASSGLAVGTDIEACKNIESIAVINNSCEETSMLEELGFQNLKYYDSYEAAIKAFKNNAVVAIASDRARFFQALSFDYRLQQKIDIVCNYYNPYYFIAFSKDVDDKIVQDCQEAINALTVDATLLDVYRKYVPKATEEMVPGLIQLHTEIDPPYNYYSENSETPTTLIGSSIDIINEMQAHSSYKNPINVSSWSTEYKALQYMPNYALFTTARTAKREELFQWVGPISATSLCFYTTTASGLKISTLDEAKALGTIATPNGWFTYDFLKQNGFQNILATATTSEEALNQLMSGEADALFLYETGFNWLCSEMNVPQGKITKQFKTGHYQYYIAFSLNTPSHLVADWQNNLDAMKEDGRFEKIWNNWYGDIPMP